MEVQIKTTVRYYLTDIRMAIRMATIKKTENNKYWQGYGETVTLCTVVKWCSYNGKQDGSFSKD